MNAAKKMWSGWNIVPSKKYRVSSFLAIVLFLLLSISMILCGGNIHEYFGHTGEESLGTYMYCFLMLLGTYSPIAILVHRWMDFDHWKDLDKDKTFRWQGWVAVCLVCGWVVVSLAWLFYIIAFCDYRKIVPGSVTPVVDPDMMLTSRISVYFLIQSFAWTGLFLLSLYSKKPPQ